MNAGNVAMGAAGLLASLVANLISVRYGRNELSRKLLARIRIAARSLLSGKDLESFFSDYCELLSALAKLAGTQCVVFLIFTLPMVGIYELTARCFGDFEAIAPVHSNAWFAGDELIFMIAFMAGTIGVFVRRRM